MSSIGDALARFTPAGIVASAAGVDYGGAVNNAIGADPFKTQNSFDPNELLTPTSGEQYSTTYNQAQDALAQQKNFLQALQAQNGLQNQTNTFNQLQGVANGTGPNPAQAMLNNTTGQNVANQAALMGSQRGAGANVGMIARQAGMNGANIQQQAAGQGAALQANQSLNALGQMGQMANQQAAQQQAGQNAYLQGTQNQFGQISGNVANQNNAVNGLNTVNANMESQANQRHSNLMGNIMGGIGSVFGMAQGGVVPSGPVVAAQPPLAQYPAPSPAQVQTPKGPKSKAGMHFKGATPMLAAGGPVPALVSPGEKYLTPQAVQAVKQGANPMQVGQTIPGAPKVGGAKDSYANDTVPKTLQEGGIVLPRSVTQSSDANKKAQAFVQAVLAKGNLPKKA